VAAVVTSNTYPTMIMQGLFRPVTESKLDLSRADVYDLDIMNQLKWNGKMYGVTYKGTTNGVFGFTAYNADVFENAGVDTPYDLWQSGKWNWESFIRIGKELLTKTNLHPVSAGYHGHRLVQTCGEDAVIFKNGKMVNNSSSQVYREGYKWLNSLTASGEHKILHYGSHDTFINAECAMYIVETWALQAGDMLSDVPFKVGFAPCPTKDGKDVVPGDVQLWGFVDGCKNLDAASYFLEYWWNPVYQEKGESVWLNDSVAKFVSYLWECPKTLQLSHSIVNYGGDYNFYDENYKLATGGVGNVDSRVDALSSVIDSNLKKMYSEFS